MNNFFSTLFRPNELICTGNLYHTEVGPLDQPFGNFVSINPLHTKRADQNVTAHRNFLIELDNGLSVADQMNLVEKVGLPYNTATWSGGKSVHFVVCLEDSVTEPEWRRLAKALIKAVPGADPSTKNPSRFTRVPGAFRIDKGTEQRLLSLRAAHVTIENLRIFCAPHLEVEVPNYRSIYNDFMGLEGKDALHPMTQAFIQGTHPCHMGRNNALFRSAADAKDCGFTYDETLDQLLVPAIGYGLSDFEIKSCIRSAFNRKRI